MPVTSVECAWEGAGTGSTGSTPVWNWAHSLAAGTGHGQQDIWPAAEHKPNCTATQGLAPRMKLWLPQQLLEQRFLFLLQEHRTGAPRTQQERDSKPRWKISLTHPAHQKTHSDQLRVNLKTIVTICVPRVNFCSSLTKSGGSRECHCFRESILKCGENQACRGEGPGWVGR